MHVFGCSLAKTWANFIILAILLLRRTCYGSSGDRTQFFRNCQQNCERQNCSADGIEIQEQAIRFYQQSVFDKALMWTCADECQYGCMWRTVEAFQERGWPVPQFYGKWPFKRFLGLQEPASVLFSIINFIVHFRNLLRLRREVRPDSPCYKLWHIFAIICLNGWFWSILFHARDFAFTELMDYAFAYSIILGTLYCMAMRMLHRKALILRALVTALFIYYFINYFAYLSVGKFSYSANMLTNVITGATSAIGWFVWCYLVRKRRPYSKRVIKFYVLLGMAMSLELFDFPPIMWTIDAHALWHFATVPVASIFYSFMIDDCKALRKEKMLQTTGFDKEI